MALPAFGLPIFTSILVLRLSKRQWPSIPWSLRKSLCSPGFVLRVCHSFPLYTLGQVVCPILRGSVRFSPHPAVLLIPLFLRTLVAALEKLPVLFKRVSMNLRMVACFGVAVHPGLSIICRITIPLHNQGSRRRSRRWKSLSAGLMVGWGRGNSLAVAQYDSDTSQWCWGPLLKPLPCHEPPQLCCWRHCILLHLGGKGREKIAGTSSSFSFVFCHQVCQFSFSIFLHIHLFSSPFPPLNQPPLFFFPPNSPLLLHFPSHSSGPACLDFYSFLLEELASTFFPLPNLLPHSFIVQKHCPGHVSPLLGSLLWLPIAFI